MAPPRPWSAIEITDNGEPLVPLPAALLRIEPHPYQALGAPYGAGACPFRLRLGVVTRLLAAQAALERAAPGLTLAIFDAWRPVAVQAFMVEHAVASTCQGRGVDPGAPSPARSAIEAEVARFWAPPSQDPATPPPHSTGAAVDLTLAGVEGALLDLGSPIDAIGAVSDPDHFAAAAAADPQGEAALWHGRRQLLAQVMAAAGFHRHPHEWWHFSHGDQLWAWLEGEALAPYGRYRGDAEESC
ncbi:M15 family metallopeptidase [Cyanobium sp. Morenito 9A2]|uniref:M15 family metallopeptidase n=1 Tax=Cyanobium sp. Morenito 9A2 TaxID=2823718 RepID=UPI0020CC41FE|nr:M15 family metallopeptidase [Cyanobium sp. Morenito 9A2]MCP9850529.1 D-alanyl-D-alanine dipeptidase [Cyanobium sp. Morenito 9A2]